MSRITSFFFLYFPWERERSPHRQVLDNCLFCLGFCSTIRPIIVNSTSTIWFGGMASGRANDTFFFLLFFFHSTSPIDSCFSISAASKIQSWKWNVQGRCPSDMRMPYKTINRATIHTSFFGFTAISRLLVAYREIVDMGSFKKASLTLIQENDCFVLKR